MATIPARARRYGFALLTIAAGWALMAIPEIGEGAGTPIIVYFFAIMLSAWYGGLGPGLLATALIVLLTTRIPMPTWRVVRLALGVAGGVSISALAEILHAARRRAERSEERYRAFLANSSEGIWCLECGDPVLVGLSEEEQVRRLLDRGVLTECNEAAARMYGHPGAAEVLGRRLADLLDPGGRRAGTLLRDFVRSGYRLVDAVAHPGGPDGESKTFVINLEGIVERGHLRRAWGIQRDVTELERTREDLRRAKESAEAANRAKDRFLAVLSHELRTPLTPVLATVTALLDEPGDPAEVRPTLELIRRSVELEARLIDDLLDVTRVVHGKLTLNRELVDTHELVHRTLGICRSDLYGRRMHLALDLSAPRHHVSADPARLQQLLWNLVKNAVKFTPAGGSLTIRTRNEGAPGEPERLVLEVADTGIGIEPEALKRIFEPFEQGEAGITRRFGGLGLGLAISRSVAEAHGGHLRAVSAGPGEGATFILELEAADAPPPGTRGGPTAGGPAAARPGLKILLVEDDRPTLKVMARLLQQRRFDVTPAESMAAALEAALREDFDLVISDIGLPDGTGWDLIQRLRSTRPVPAIALTGFGMEEDVRRTRDSGFVEHLTKPVNFGELEAAIRRVSGSGPPGRVGAAIAPGPR